MMETINILSGSFAFSIMKTPNSKFIYVGSVPACLLIEKKNKLGQLDFVSPIFETYREAEQFLVDKAKENTDLLTFIR